MAYYDNKPSKLEAVGNGSHIYRWNIEEITVSPANGEGEKTRKQWVCDEVTVWEPFNRKKITEAVIVSRWDGNVEKKLINDYNAAMAGLYGEDEKAARIKAYTDFLTERATLKAQVKSDCEELGIL